MSRRTHTDITVPFKFKHNEKNTVVKLVAADKRRSRADGDHICNLTGLSPSRQGGRIGSHRVMAAGWAAATTKPQIGEKKRETWSATVSTPESPGAVQYSVNSARVLPFVTRDEEEVSREWTGGAGEERGGAWGMDKYQPKSAVPIVDGLRIFSALN